MGRPTPTSSSSRSRGRSLILGHGAGGGVTAPDLVAVTEAARDGRFSVVLRGAALPRRRAASLRHRRANSTRPGSRSSTTFARASCAGCRSSWAGARWARASPAARSRRPVRSASCASPSRCCRRAGRPRRQSRLPELDAVTVPVLVVQGERDPFGMPPPGPGREVVQVPGNHGLKADLPAVAAAAGDWLRRVTG